MMGLLDRLKNNRNENIFQLGVQNQKKEGRKWKEDKISCR
jgi:hypothetical protein